jgi:hypothetical protein
MKIGKKYEDESNPAATMFHTDETYPKWNLRLRGQQGDKHKLLLYQQIIP